MATLTEGNHTGDFIKELVSTVLCFEQITVTGGKYPAGTVLSKNVDKWGEAVAAADEHCVLVRAVDASVADQPGNGLMRLAAVKADHLEWPEGFADADKATIIAAMKTAHLIAQ